MTYTSKQILSEAMSTLNSIKQIVKTEYAGLTPKQLNWKPSPDAWSIAQVLKHLIQSDELYFPILDSATNKYKGSATGSEVIFKPSFFGKMLYEMIKPQNTKKVPSPKSFIPSASDYGSSVVDEYLSHIDILLTKFTRLAGLNLNKIKMHSPVSVFLRLNAGDCVRVFAAHTDRHFAQLARIKNTPGFPLGEADR